MATAISTTTVGSPGIPLSHERTDGGLAPRQRAFLWLFAFALLGIALTLIFPDSSSEDGGAHFLEAHWAWSAGHHHLLVDVWGRPLFTVLYSLAAPLGYPAAKLVSVSLALGTAWQSWRAAEDYQFAHPELAIPLLLLQPTFLSVAPETMTEPLFTLVLIVALRAHLHGRIALGAFLASLLPLARPEGPFLVALWGVWILARQPDRKGLRAIPLLASGMLLWWLAALLITHDPLWIRHNAPWHLTSAEASRGSFWAYWQMRAEWIGAVLQYPFVVGLVVLVARRRALEAVSAVVLVFLLHSTMWKFGLLNSEGYARYLANVAPLIALITLAGWNAVGDVIAAAAARLQRPQLGGVIASLLAAGALGLSTGQALLYIDGQQGSRDAWAMREMREWFLAHPLPVERLGFSRSYMAILFNRDPWQNLNFTSDRAANATALQQAPPRTLVFWDDVNGESWYHLRPADFAAAGFERLRSRSYALASLLPGTSRYHDGSVRHQVMHLFYKP